MAVLMASTTLGVVRVSSRLGPFGDPIPDNPPTASPDFLPGRALETSQGVWVLALDPTLWPVRAGDVIADGQTGQQYVVRAAQVCRNTVDPSVDYVRVEATESVPAGVEPGGVGSVGR